MSIYAPQTDTARCAHWYLTHGFSVIPLWLGGSKAPIVKEVRVYSWEEIAHWFNRPCPCAIGLLCGRRSRGLESLDFDAHKSPSVYPQWAARIDPALLARLVITATPSGGRHVEYLSPTTEGSTALARAAKNADDHAALPHATIELLSEGHYVVSFGSPPKTHDTGLPYRLLQGDPSDPPLITIEEREQLHNAAKSLNLYHAEPTKPHKPIDRSKLHGRQLAGDIYNQEAEWQDILEPHGWRIARTKGDTTYWTRPDGTRGHTHATTGYGSVDKCRFFTDCPPHLNPDESHSKFAVWTALNHDGDFKRAAAALKNKHLSSGG